MSIDVIRTREWLEKHSDYREGTCLVLDGLKYHPHPEGYRALLALEVEYLCPTLALNPEGIVAFSVHLYVKTNYLRDAGKYRNGKATATVTDSTCGTPGSRPAGYALIIHSPNLDDLKKLYELIRAGEITPHKYYDVEQLQPLSSRLLRFIQAMNAREQRVRGWFRQAFGKRSA